MDVSTVGRRLPYRGGGLGAAIGTSDPTGIAARCPMHGVDGPACVARRDRSATGQRPCQDHFIPIV